MKQKIVFSHISTRTAYCVLRDSLVVKVILLLFTSVACCRFTLSIFHSSARPSGAFCRSSGFEKHNWLRGADKLCIALQSARYCKREGSG